MSSGLIPLSRVVMDTSVLRLGPVSYTHLDVYKRQVLDAAQIAPFHQALRETPGRVFLYVHDMTRFLPVTALDAQAWNRCVDPARRDAKACE